MFWIVFLASAVCVSMTLLVLSINRLMMKRRREAAFRRVEREGKCCLPDVGNDYLRSKLQTSLAVSEGALEENDVGFLHAKKLLYALSEKRLSGADSLIVRKMQKDVGRYEANELLPSGEKRNVAHLFSKLLSLCAKYEIE